MSKGGSPERHKNGVLREEENEYRDSGMGHAVGQRPGAGEEAQGDCVAGQPVDRDAHEATALTHAWIHGLSLTCAAGIRDVSQSTMM